LKRKFGETKLEFKIGVDSGILEKKYFEVLNWDRFVVLEEK